MSRVHDALRRAERGAPLDEQPLATDAAGAAEVEVEPAGETAAARRPEFLPVSSGMPAAPSVRLNIHAAALAEVALVPFQPAPESHLLDLNNSHETPAEEFRTLRTRLNHLQTLQPLHTVIVTSPSPAEGKTFTAVNLALAEAHLAESSVLLGDFDLRRPIVHNLFQVDRAPGLSDYLTGQCTFAQALRRVEGMNLYLLPAGSPVKNPLELLNMRTAKVLFEELPRSFNWAIFDTPPLLFSADANLLSTMADGTVLVVKIGSTTFDNVTRAMQSLCENNVLGIVANGARASELYSKYTYYYSRSE
ncbi:MAG TPA: CpsD/CapB family tyrosine-protein kinase [Candidatus Sulfopaludibacter sp.]|jgi:receptor protein-tyrosine kinase|nr:CpsD/CapB family tyrosine-protein kinase [Candidatus Sulfopaludibacter sp.]